MITKWKVVNFKSIRDETELDLGPLTIFAGANSSGKSTLFQSVLVIAQTLAHKVGSKSVVLNGALTNLGQFDDLKSNGGASKQITIKCTCRPFPDLDVANLRARFNQFQEISCEISFDSGVSSSQPDFHQIQPRLVASQLSCKLKDEDNVDQKADISITRHPLEAIHKFESERVDPANAIGDQLRESLAYDVKLDDSSKAEIKEKFNTAKLAGCMFRHFLPEKLVYDIDTIEEKARALAMALQINHLFYFTWYNMEMGRDFHLSREIIAALREILEGTIALDIVLKDENGQVPLFDSGVAGLPSRTWVKALYDGLHTHPRSEQVKVYQVLREREDLFDVIHETMKASVTQGQVPRQFILQSPPRLITEATSYLDDFFATSLKYLGPLRDVPKPMYPLAPATADPHDVGLRGEHTASILELHKNKDIRYIPSANFKNPEIDRNPVTRKLETAVIDWLKYLAVADSVKSWDRGKLGYELKVGLSYSDSTHDLTHVGVGASQVLPILVMCLLADTDSTLVFEQPELHLHPKVQTLLGDFFLSMALCNKQCIVETHSEYLIDRLRFRIAAATPEKELKSQPKIYFVEQSSQGTTFREVVINEYGAVLDWPEGFFDQSHQQAEEILRAAAMKRKASRRNKDA